MLRKDIGQFLPYDKFIVKKQISQGSQGIVFMAFSHKQCSTVAVKVEKGSQKYPNLRKEISNLQILKDAEGVPKLLEFECDSNTSQFAYFSMQLLGKDLNQLLKKCGGFFSSQTVILIAIQVIQTLRDIHNKGLIHRDIKPENLVLGIGQNRKRLYVIDFGTAKQFIDPQTQTHIPFQVNQPFVGTYRYSSIAPHLGHEQGRKDDLISLGYVLVYLAKGRLPWQDLKSANGNDAQTQIGHLKQTTSIDDLCDGLPYFFKDYFTQLAALEFSSEPEYENLIHSAQECLEMEFKTNDESPFDWAALSLNQSHACLSHQDDRRSNYSHQALFLSHNNLATSQKFIPNTNSEQLQAPPERITDTNENYSRHVYCEEENGNGQISKKLIPHFFKDNNKFQAILTPIIASKSTQSIEYSPELRYKSINTRIDEIKETSSNFKIDNSIDNLAQADISNNQNNGSNGMINTSKQQQKRVFLEVPNSDKNQEEQQDTFMLDTLSISDEITTHIQKQIPFATSLSPKQKNTTTTTTKQENGNKQAPTHILTYFPKSRFFDGLKDGQIYNNSISPKNNFLSDSTNRKTSITYQRNQQGTETNVIYNSLLKLQKIKESQAV